MVQCGEKVVFSIALIFLINSSWYLRDGRVNCKMVAFSMFQLLFRLILVDKISAGWQGLARGLLFLLLQRIFRLILVDRISAKWQGMKRWLLFLLLQRLFRIVLVDKISARWQGMARCSRSWRTRGGMRDSSLSSTRPALPPDMNYTQYQTMWRGRSVFGRLRLLV